MSRIRIYIENFLASASNFFPYLNFGTGGIGHLHSPWWGPESAVGGRTGWRWAVGVRTQASRCRPHCYFIVTYYCICYYIIIISYYSNNFFIIKYYYNWY